MSLIACTSNCIYQENGYCNLNQAAASGEPSDTGCIHYIPKPNAKYDCAAKKNPKD